MDFPERLEKRIASRIGSRRIVFKQYSRYFGDFSKQIEDIIFQRISKLQIFEAVAIEYLCKRIATFSSDIRKTLHVGRRAIEICQVISFI